MACVNHDPKALRSHWENHPEVVHFEEDIRTLDLTGLCELVLKYRLLYPHAKVILWASLECTNFSKAKGGQPRDADSRTLADHLPRYITALNPDYVQIENVVEFMSWGPLDENGKPVSKRSGADWLKWREHINSFGYRDEWKEMNSADFGAYTSRNRLFGCFAKHGLPIVWPEPTHAKKATGSGLFGTGLQKWKAVKDVLDFEDEGESIFTRKKPLSDKTLERIYAGLIKYVAGGKDAFMVRYNSMSASGSFKQTATDIEHPCPTVTVQNRLGLCFIAKYYSGKPEGKVIPVTGPAGTIKCSDGQALVNAQFLIASNGGMPSSKVFSVENPCRVVTTSDNKGLVQPVFMVQRNSGDPDGRVISVDGPSRTLTSTGGNQELVQPSFIAKYYGNGDNISSVNDPAGTITTKDRLTKVQAVWLDKTYSGKDNHQSIEQPAGVVMVNDHHQKVTTKPFIMDTNYSNVGSSIEEPKRTLLSSRRHSYIINPSHVGWSTSTEAPSPVIIARQDKSPLYLTQVEEGQMMVLQCEQFLTEDDYGYLLNGDGDESVRVKIIEFMILYGIADIKMRMLKVSELKLIQGFPADYKLYGNQSDQKKFIGNSVVPHVVQAWCQTMANKIREIRRAA